jgi:hypothetical protein
MNKWKLITIISLLICSVFASISCAPKEGGISIKNNDSKNTEKDDVIIYSFEKEGDITDKGFKMDKNLSYKVLDKVLELKKLDSSDSYIYSPDNLSFDAAAYKFIIIKMRNDTSSALTRFSWTTNEETEFNKSKREDLVISQNTPMTENIIDLSTNSEWKNTITGFRIDFAYSVPYGTVGIEYIAFSKTGKSIDSNKREPIKRQVEVGYLLDEYFKLPIAKADTQELLLSGWDYDKAGGEVAFNFNNPLTITDNKEDATVKLNKEFLRQEKGTITWEFRFKMAKTIEGLYFQLMDGKAPSLQLIIKDGKLCYQNDRGEFVPAFLSSNWIEYGIRAEINLDNKTFNLYVNGVLAAKSIRLLKDIKSIDHIQIETGKESKGVLELWPIVIHKGYEVNEKFLATLEDTVPYDYIVNASKDSRASTAKIEHGPKPDIYSFVLEDKSSTQSTSFKKKFNTINENQIVEFKFFEQNTINGSSIKLFAGDAEVAGIFLENNKLYAISSEGKKEISVFTPNLWNDVRIHLNKESKSYDLYLNGRKRLSSIKTNGQLPDSIVFETGTAASGTMIFDDILVYRDLPLPSDYVSKPTPVKTDYLVGVQSFDGFREGFHLGWDYIKDYGDRKPIIGYYTQSLPEVNDWETKFMVEHGITFNLRCWFRPSYTIGKPVKQPDWDALNNGFFYSQYSDMVKYAIMWENQHSFLGVDNLEDFKENLVPYWLEYYFKDPRYLVVDNKPVFSVYQQSGLIRDFGGVEGAKKATDYLRSECIKAGFSGIYILGENRYLDKAKLDEMIKCGIDYAYSYTWFTSNLFEQQVKMETQKGFNSIDTIPTLSVGWDSGPWGGSSIGFISPQDMQKLAKWCKDEYMPSFNKNKLGSKMVMLDNWNEWGEGHYIMPSSLGGYGYIDAIRTIFTENSEHYDMLPTENQKARLDVLYPRSWK